MASIFRRCGCRRDDGGEYPMLPERPTERQRMATCPRLLRDGKHGSWGFYVSGPVDRATGRRLQIRRMGFSTKREAQQACAIAVQAVRSGRRQGGQGPTVESWLTQWLERKERDGLRAATVASYGRYIRNELSPAIGNVRLHELTRHHVDDLVQQLARAGRGVTTIHRIHAVLSSALTMALQLDLVQQNAASHVALPRKRDDKLRVWEPAEVNTFLRLAATHRLGPVFELVVRTGLRRGEVAGLRWADIDLDGGRLVVRQQRVQVDTVVVTNHAKTHHGQDRRVSLDAVTVRQLWDWRARQHREQQLWDNLYQDEGWVFTYEDGRPLNPYYISDVFRKLVARAGLPHLTFHGLRHEHASLLLSAGVPITAVSKRLGHSSTAITGDLYSHLLDDADRQMAEAVQAVLGGTESGLHTHRTHNASKNDKKPRPTDQELASDQGFSWSG